MSVKTKAFLLCLLLFIVGFSCGFIFKGFIQEKSDYAFQYNFERLGPLTKELELSDVQKALLFNILADNKNVIDSIMKSVSPRIKIQLHLLRENIKSILDDRQKEIYINLLKEHEAKKIEEQIAL